MTEAKTDSKTMNLVQRLNVASKLIKPVGKDGENGFQKYRFQSEAAIKAVVKPALEAAGLAIIPSYEVINNYDRPSNKGGNNHFVDVIGTFTITDGHDSITGSMAGGGQDSGEKAVVKAETAAQKYFFKQLFNISDQEADPDETDSAAATGTARQSKPVATEPVASAQEMATFKQLLADFAAKDGSQPNDIYKSIASSAGVTTKFNELSEAELGKLKIALSKITG